MAGNVGSIRAGRAFVELFADDSKLVRGLKGAQRKLQTFGRTLRSAGTRVFAAGAAMTGGFALATRVFMAFDDQMRTVKAVTGASAEQFQMLTETAKELGRTTSFTAQQVAAGMTELGRAGFSSDEINASIGDILNLSRATGVELAEAADIAGASLRAFDLEAGEMGRVADVLTATANTSAQTITELGEAMKYAAPVASTYGLTLEETAKTLGALANFGIKGSMAGNTLKRVMLQIADPKVQNTLEGMGVAVTDAGGNLRTVSAILADVGQAMQNMGQAQRVSLLSELFGDRAIAGAAKLTGASFDRLNEAIDNAAGTAARTAKEMDAGIGGALRRFWSAVEGIALAIGDALAPAISSIADWLSKAAGFVTAFVKAHKPLVVMIAKVAVIGAAVGAVLIGLGVAASVGATAIGGLATIVSVLGTVLGVGGSMLGASLSPIGLVIAGVVALGAAILYWTGAGGKALEWLKGIFGNLAKEVGEAFGAIGEAMASGDIGLAAKVLWLTLKLQWQKGIAWLSKLWLDFRNFFIRIAYDAFYGAVKVAETVWHGLEIAWIETTSFLSTTWTRFCQGIGKAWNWAGTQVSKAWNWLKGLFDDSFDSDTANRQADAWLAAENKKVDERANAAVRAREAQRQKERDAEERIHQAALDQLDAEQEAKKKALDEEYDQRIAAAQGEVDAARKEWQDAIAEAKRKRGEDVKKDATPDATGGKTDGKKPKAPTALFPWLAKGVAEVQSKFAALGTFSTAALRGLSIGGASAAERTAKAAEKTAENTDRLVDMAGDGGLTFEQ